MEPLADTSNLRDAGGTPLGARKSAQKTPGDRHRRRSLLQGLGTGTPGTIGRRRDENRRLSRALASESRGATQDILNPEQVSALYQQCIKLATENKITAKNTWALGLIDHLHDLVQPDGPDGSMTNFQRASVTLGAGVEIYAKRVDSVHTEAYKVLGGLSRGGAAGAAADEEDAPGETQEGGGGEEGEEAREGRRARRAAMLRDVNPASTLEASFEALNVKKFDLAFAVDPLFHKTSAQFDEGGARGLLLHNLSVFRGCEILFDSQEQPELPPPGASDSPGGATVDLSGMQPQIRQALAEMQTARLCPAVDELYALLGRAPESDFEAEAAAIVASVEEEAREPSSLFEQGLAAMSEDEAASQGSAGNDYDDGWAGMDGPDDFEVDDVEGEGEEAADMTADGAAGGEAADGPAWLTQQPYSQDANDSQPPPPHGGEDWQDESSGLVPQPEGGLDAVAWLVSRVESLSLDGKAWAGTSHWRFRNRGGPEQAPVSRSQPKKAAGRKRGEPLDFGNLLPMEAGALKLANARDISLKSWGARAPTLLPEDVHFQPSRLFESFLRPGCPIYEPAAQPSGGTGAGDAGGGTWDGYDAGGADFDDDDHYDGGGGWADADFGDAGELVEAPRKVAQLGINYARRSKQVDVRALKHSLWHILGERQDAARRSGGAGGELSFQDVISRLGPDCEAGSLPDLSVHLCFICVLHLANEHGLAITDAPSLDQMRITGVPDSCTL